MMKEKLQAAIDKKNNDITTFIWKGKKVEVDGKFVQEEKRLVDCTEDELKSFYQHCETMLNNADKDYPGRNVLMGIIDDQMTRCNVELFLRYMAEEPRNINKVSFLQKIRQILANNPQADPKKCKITEMVGGCPAEFEDLSIDIVRDGCLDRLGKFDRKHITLTFILKHGLWFAPQESQDIAEYQKKNNISNKQEAAKAYLGLRTNLELKLNPKGLSLAAMRAMVKLNSVKYSDLTTLQLRTLRDVMLFDLESEVKFHIQQWEKRKQQLIKVAEAKGFNIVSN